MVVIGAWYGVENASRGAMIVAGAATIAWLGYPLAARVLAWRRHRLDRRAIALATAAEQAVDLALKAKHRADGRPGSKRLTKRAQHLTAKARASLERAKRSAAKAKTRGSGAKARETRA